MDNNNNNNNNNNNDITIDTPFDFVLNYFY